MSEQQEQIENILQKCFRGFAARKYLEEKEQLNDYNLCVENAIAEINKLIIQKVNEAERRGRIDEVKNMINYERSLDTSRYSYVNIQHIKDRLKELRESDTLQSTNNDKDS